MGWIKKGILLFVGISLLGSGLWLLGILCLGYLAFSLFSGGKANPSLPRSRRMPSARYLAAFLLAVLSLVALGSGGTLSPLVFGVLAGLVFFWPSLPLGGFASRTAPVKGTILLRSSLVPFVWHSLAEVKPGAEDLARALSSFEGRLMVVKDGKVYAYAKTFAFDARAAEQKLTAEFRKMAGSVTPGGAYLLPLDSEISMQAFCGRHSLTPTAGALPWHTPDLLVLDTSRGFVPRAGSYVSVPGGSGSSIPQTTRPLSKAPLTWEALESLGKKLRWPEPDSFSNLLQSVHASRHEPLSERLGGLESSGEKLKVQALGGDEVELSRAQLRAIVSIYE